MLIALKKAPFVKNNDVSNKSYDHLIYEIMDGQAIYHKGFKDNLEGKGINFLKSRIVTCLTLKIHDFLDEEYFTVLAHGVGIHLDKSNNLAGDVLVLIQRHCQEVI
jgi:hypothetical protein